MLKAAGVYRGPLSGGGGFLTTRFLGVAAGWELLCALVVVVPGVRVLPGTCRVITGGGVGGGLV